MVDFDSQRPSLPVPAYASKDRETLVLEANQQKTKTTKAQLLDRLHRQLQDLRYQIELTDARLDEISLWDDNADNTPKQDRAVTLDRSPAVALGQLRWIDNLADHFDKIGQSPGNVSGVVWCHGILIAENQLLTVGHFLDRSGGWQRPSHYGVVPPPTELATYFQVSVNFPNPKGGYTPCNYTIEKLLHLRPDGLDCAIVQLAQVTPSTSEIKTLAANDDSIMQRASQQQYAAGMSGKDFLDQDVYLMNPASDNENPNGYKVRIRARHRTGFSFFGDTPVSTISGTPLVTAEGHIIGLQISKNEALDIQVVLNLLEPVT